MIPIRVALEGFMSYREPAALDFEGAPLWMLSGPNGSGKSTIFDAITFALFGLHRGGKQNADELINQNSNGLVVEFDFAVGEDVYRAKRTLARKGRGSVQGYHLRGPNAPQPGRPAPQAMPETEQKAGFEKWIESLVGLDDETFTASVLLQQGKSEVLLDANPARRHEMLAQIVDLSSYQELHQKADARRRELEAETKTLNTQIEGIEPVEEAEIAQLGAEAEAAGAQAKQWQETQLQLARRSAQAERWEELNAERAKLETAINAATALFAEAETIERDATRRRELDDVLPRLAGLLTQREQWRACRARLAEQEKRAVQAQTAVAAADAARQEAEAERARLEAATNAARERREAAHRTLHELAAPLHELGELARLQSEVAALDQQLQAFAPDLDAQREKLESEAAAQRELSVAVPWLEEWAKARAEWSAAKEKAARADEALQATQTQLAAIAEREAAAQAERDEAARRVETHQNELTQARTLLEQVKINLADFERAAGQPSCPTCGQALTPAHLAAERARLEKESSEYSQSAQLAGERRAQAMAARQQLDEQLECLRQERRRHEQRQHEADCDRRDARAAGVEIKSRAENALEHLPASWAERIRPDATLSVTKCFAAPFPDAAELERLRGQCAGQRDSEAQLRQIQEQIAQRDALRARREPSAARQSTLEAAYPPSQAAALRARAQEAEAQSRDAESAAQALLEPLDAARAAEHEALNAAQEAREQMATAQAAIQAESARCEQIEHGLQTRIAELSAAWQSAIKPLDDDALSAQINLWRGEAEALNEATQRLDDLRAAQSQHEARVERQRNLTAALEAVPEEARRAPAELRAQEAEAKERAEAAAAQERVLRSEQQSRAETRQRRAELEESYHRAAHSAQLHKILAELLGRDKLQRFLLQQAEAGIVSNANQVLDRISGGALRLELRRHQENEEESPRRARSAPKALDLIAINTATGEKPLPVYLLSGSQRFRVAVSLALGIGQFASQSARRIESVIIDEGFGGLDQEGRREIIDELHHLKTELKRIILVSHQEEFADAFPNRYSIALKDGTSTASLVDGS